MTQKFGRNFRLTIDPKDGQAPIVISLPFTCHFFVKRDLNAAVNNASVEIYNLSETNRKRIFQDRNNLGQVVGANGTLNGRRSAKLDVGYGQQLYTIWQGDILQASSAREGNNIITRLESLTGIYDVASSFINTTLPSGTTLKQLFTTLIGQMPTLQLGYVSNFTQVFNQPVPLNGKPWDIIQNYANQNNIAYAFIDNGKVYIMNQNPLAGNKIDVISSGSSVPVINAASGLLETPRREQTYISVTTLLEANIRLNSIVQIQSTVEPAFNKQYQVIGIQHTGTISSAVSSDARSTFFLLEPGFLSYNQVQVA